MTHKKAQSPDPVRITAESVIEISPWIFSNGLFTFSRPRQHGGIQVRWNKGEQPTWAQVWNPWCASIPWINLSHHPLLYNPKEYETAIYNVDEFYESLIQAISNSYKEKRPDAKITIVEGPILIESYASLSSMIYNQSGLGFNRDRKGISFWALHCTVLEKHCKQASIMFPFLYVTKKSIFTKIILHKKMKEDFLLFRKQIYKT